MKKAAKQSTVISALSIASVLLLLGTAVSVLLFTLVSTRLSDATTNRYNLTYYANQFLDGSNYLTNEVRAYAATALQEHYDNYWNEVNTLKNREAGIAGMKEIGITEEEQSMIDQMSSLSEALVPLESEAMEYAAKGYKVKATNYVYGADYNASIAQISRLQEQFLQALNTRSLAEIERLVGFANLMTTLMWIMVISTAILQLFYIFYIRRKMLRPVIAIKNELEEVAKGNLSSLFSLTPDTSEIGMLINAILRTKETLKRYIGDISEKLSRMADNDISLKVSLEYIGDFRPIQDALNTILGSLNRTLRQVEVASVQVSTNSQQVSQGANSLAQGATIQASSVEELSATINDLSTRMDQIARNAKDAKSISVHATDTLHICNGKMNELVAAMNNISDTSNEIAKIIGAIENIAFQTNILALNAAVEAARAGTAGKGFAVVADEVRTLANKSQEAAKDTAALITGAVEAVENGTKIVDETAQIMISVVSGSNQSTEYVQEIANHSEEQALALQQLTEGVNQIADVVQTNSATAEESAATAEELSTQASTMQQLMSAFRFR